MSISISSPVSPSNTSHCSNETAPAHSAMNPVHISELLTPANQSTTQLNGVRITAGPSGSLSSNTLKVSSDVGLTPKKAFIHYYDKATKQLWKISIQTGDGNYIKQTDAFLQRTKKELIDKNLLQHLDQQRNTISHKPPCKNCLINNKLVFEDSTKTNPIQFSDSYIADYDNHLANTNFDTDIVVNHVKNQPKTTIKCEDNDAITEASSHIASLKMINEVNGDNENVHLLMAESDKAWKIHELKKAEIPNLSQQLPNKKEICDVLPIINNDGQHSLLIIDPKGVVYYYNPVSTDPDKEKEELLELLKMKGVNKITGNEHQISNDITNSSFYCENRLEALCQLKEKTIEEIINSPV